MKMQKYNGQLCPTVLAKTGSGKSMILKKTLQGKCLKEKEIGSDSELPNVDNTGEYTAISKSLEGKTIHLP